MVTRSLAPFAIPSQDLVIGEVDVLDSQPQPFHVRPPRKARAGKTYCHPHSSATRFVPTGELPAQANEPFVPPGESTFRENGRLAPTGEPTFMTNEELVPAGELFVPV